MKCNHCGYENLEDSKFCENCGHELSQVDSPPISTHSLHPKTEKTDKEPEETLPSKELEETPKVQEKKKEQEKQIEEEKNEKEELSIKEEPSSSLTKEELFKVYIKTPDKFFWYQKAFDRYEEEGTPKLKWVWSWWALFGGPYYLFYRKCYLEAVLSWILLTVLSTSTAGIGSIAYILGGGIFPYFVYKRYKKILADIQPLPEKDQLGALKSAGGVNRWAIFLFVLLGVLGFFAFIAVIWLVGASMGMEVSYTY